MLIIVFIVGIFIAWLNVKINEGLVNIVVLRKNYIEEVKIEEEWKVLEGTIPKGGAYSLIYYISIEERNKLSLLDKVFGGIYLGNLIKKISPSVNFVVRMKKVE